MAKLRTTRQQSDVLTRVFQPGTKRLRRQMLKAHGMQKPWAKAKARDWLRGVRS